MAAVGGHATYFGIIPTRAGTTTESECTLTSCAKTFNKESGCCEFHSESACAAAACVVVSSDTHDA